MIFENIGFIKFDYFINQNGEIIKEFKDVLKEKYKLIYIKDL